MSGCSLVAAGLPALIGSATPTFSYNPNQHTFAANDYFGVQVTYMSGTTTCYSGTRPTFTPVISNPYLLYTRTCAYVTQGAPATYTGIYCPDAKLWNWINAGAYTIDNYVNFNIFAVLCYLHGYTNKHRH
ncbi:hypothetical protein EJ02DRAFT_419549 [Clathrospora elynae]|uniref:Uncharacterized protein n=1 Tax=Clathrospora elynae TaxID=706981 RepID=A0A6A5T3F4_9PLEO|nr:hypothetical protein EJ02DRAFT_419549 [Clathrospora elynae]